MSDRTPFCPPLARYVDLTDACPLTDDDHPRWPYVTVSGRAVARRALQLGCLLAVGPVAAVVLSTHNYVRMIRRERAHPCP